MGPETGHRRVLGHGRRWVRSYEDQITEVTAVTDQRQGGRYFAVTRPVGGLLRFASVSVKDAGLHEGQVLYGELGVVSGESEVVQSMTGLEKVEVRRCESVMTLPVSKHEWEFGSEYPISSDWGHYGAYRDQRLNTEV
jgi:hypothetical protein